MHDLNIVNEDRIRSLDSLRGIAILLVVIYHFTSRFPLSYYGFTAKPLVTVSFGYLGVQLFFMISGFVIPITLIRCNSQFDFLFKRFARLYPAYWFAIVFTFCAVELVGLPGREVSLQAAMINLTMLQTAFHVADVDGAYWSLFHEIVFYGVISLVYFYTGRDMRRSLAFLLPLPVIFYLASFKFKLGFFWFFFVLSFPLFMAGISMYLIFVQKKADWLTLAGIANCALMTLLTGTSLEIAIVFIFMSFLLVVAFHLPAFFSNSFLLFFGFISYSLYLIHQNIGVMIIRNLTARGVDAYLAIAIAMASVIALACAMKVALEEPFRRLLVKLYRSALSMGHA